MSKVIQLDTGRELVRKRRNRIVLMVCLGAYASQAIGGIVIGVCSAFVITGIWQ